MHCFFGLFYVLATYRVILGQDTRCDHIILELNLLLYLIHINSYYIAIVLSVPNLAAKLYLRDGCDG